VFIYLFIFLGGGGGGGGGGGVGFWHDNWDYTIKWFRVHKGTIHFT